MFIPYAWRLKLDTAVPILNELTIDGELHFEDTADRTLEAYKIWVRVGDVFVGDDGYPFTHQAKIILHGSKDDDHLVVDPGESGNKMLAVTGGLNMFGVPPGTIWTKLTAMASVGATTISVE